MKIRLSLFFIILLLIISGCSSQDTSTSNIDKPEVSDNYIEKDANIDSLNEEISNLNKMIKKQEDQILVLKQSYAKEIEKQNSSINNDNYVMFYKELNFDQCLLTADVELRHEPNILCETPRTVEKKTLVKVLAAIDVLENNEIHSWLFVMAVTYDDPYNNVGWIKEEDTTLLTEENRYTVISPVRLKKGCINLDNSDQEIDLDGNYKIYSIDGEIAFIGSIGGWSATIEKKYIEYPEPNTK